MMEGQVLYDKSGNQKPCIKYQTNQSFHIFLHACHHTSPVSAFFQLVNPNYQPSFSLKCIEHHSGPWLDQLAF